ncbi:outer membrane protein assembly factor BamA [Pseudodesulfovibrio tunisiensis]|uniref:outer membrane protein assembly factor BamA n=1 Tax=Pseudodesulfovibrio tunisiensis TaxID=463192 RepID=UPI001FB4DA0E|nr:outer membrane protein assembly factor BamA [Pseudodesulfovibrio tunisiensis]
MPANRFRVLVAGVLATLLLGFASIGAAADISGDVKIAVMPFTVNAGEELSYLKDSLPELFSDRLHEAGFEVVDQAEVKRIMAEKGFAAVTPDAAREVALLSGAGFAVFGTFNQIGDDLTIDARLVESYGTKPARKVAVTEQGLINLLPAVDAVVDRMKMTLLKQDVIADVQVEGTKVLDKEVVLMRLTLRKGDLLTGKAVNTALKNIYDLGYFDDVTVKVEDTSEGKNVIFDVKEKPRIQAVGVRGADALDSEDIVEAVSTKKGGVVNPKVLADDIRVIREMYRKEGYYKAKVTHEIESAGDGIARLTFVIDEGPKLYVKEVVIDGAQQLDPDDIKDVLAVKERGFLSWITNTGVLKEELLERDAAAIMAFYNSKGFIDAKVGRPEIDIKDDGIYVIYQVWEGDRYKMGETLFEGDLIDDPAKLMAVTKVHNLKLEDEYFDRSLLKGDVERLTQYYTDYGYAYAEVGVRLQDHRDDKVVDVVFNMSKHQRVHIRRVLVEGNTATRDNVILREMRLADGDMFSGEKLTRSQQRLNNLGFFEKVDIAPIPTGDPDEMDLIVKVKDKPTGRIGGGIGYSTYDGVYLAAEITERNLFGRGYSLGLNGLVGQKNNVFSLSFINPHLNDTDVGFGVTAYNRDEDFTDYDKSSTGGVVEFFYPVGEYSTLKWSYTGEYYEISDLASDASKSLRDEKGAHVLSQLAASVERDTRDDYMNPTTGTIIKGTVANGGGLIGGTDDFFKWTVAHDWYTPAIEKFVFHSKFWVGFVHQNFGGDRIPTTQRFRLGGLNSVRGYSSYRIGPIDSDDRDEVLGGDKAFYMNLEVRRVLSKEYGINGLVFFDAGNAWDEGEMLFEPVERYGQTPSLGLYKSVGAGLHWFSPMGPVGFVYGYGLDELENSSRHKIELVMGQRF